MKEVIKMEKQKITKFNNDYYLLGINQNNEMVWLKRPSWDCDWYWSLGYVQTFDEYYSDINMHAHFDLLFLNTNKNSYNTFREYFKETTLSNKELWTLLECMKSLYTLREYSNCLHRGGSHCSANPCKELLKNDDEYDRINKILIPNLWEQVENILKGNK